MCMKIFEDFFFFILKAWIEDLCNSIAKKNPLFSSILFYQSYLENAFIQIAQNQYIVKGTALF